MSSQITRITTSSQTAPAQKRSWLAAYGKFLVSPRENLLLKIAPLAFIIGAPELIASEFLPVIGEVTDLGAFVLMVIVAFRTLRAVNRYR